MKLFLSTSFSCKVDEDGVIFPEYKALISERLAQLRASGHEVFCVIEERGWRMYPDEDKGEQVGADIAELRKADALVAVCGDEVSAGLHWECGFMTGLEKPVYLWPEKPVTKIPYWTQGLIELGDVQLVTIAEEVQ